jgi:NADH:ubiquinone oxidoreductase subunit E
MLLQNNYIECSSAVMQLNTWANTATNRQLQPIRINRYNKNYCKKRKQKLTKMLEVIQKGNGWFMQKSSQFIP